MFHPGAGTHSRWITQEEECAKPCQPRLGLSPILGDGLPGMNFGEVGLVRYQYYRLVGLNNVVKAKIEFRELIFRGEIILEIDMIHNQSSAAAQATTYLFNYSIEFPKIWIRSEVLLT